MKKQPPKDVTLNDLGGVPVVVMATGIEIIPGFAGSPAYLPHSQAIREFWKDRKFFLHMLKCELPCNPTIIRVPIKFKGRSYSPTAYTDHVAISCDAKNIKECPMCHFPMIDGGRCISCKWKHREGYPDVSED